mmetsp:Transcript_55411/g.171676  ORF Transcript_55411/g.171676 Transcript_55411/m.171676 type:complete len:254 (-) Transcript_55411:182-943(-)
MSLAVGNNHSPVALPPRPHGFEERAKRASWMRPCGGFGSLVKRSTRSARAISRRGAALPVQISHWAQPCSKSISKPSTIAQPLSAACCSRAVKRLPDAEDWYAASTTTGWHVANIASGRVKPAELGKVPMTASNRVNDSRSLASLTTLNFSPNAFANAAAFSVVRFNTCTSAKPSCAKACAAARAVPPAPRMRPTRPPGRSLSFGDSCLWMPIQSVLSPFSRPVPSSLETVLTAPIVRADSLSSSMCSNKDSL